MFKKNVSEKKQTEQPLVPPVSHLKYEHPKILLIDLDNNVQKTLESEGYNVSVGTFGRPYKVQKSSGYEPVVVKASLPNHTEQEIIVIDLVPNEPIPDPPTEKTVPMQDLDWWAKCSKGVIDPRPRVMYMVHEQFDRVLENGGAFIIFSDEREYQEIVLARNYNRHDGLTIEKELPYNNWSFLSIFSNLGVSRDHGKEIGPVEIDCPLVRLLTAHLKGASFCCTFDADWQIKSQWLDLAKNKYGATVSGVIYPPAKSKRGWIFVLPRISDRASFLAAFLKNILPELSPSLFPHAEGQRWVHRPEYELQSVIEKAKTISSIQDEAAQKVTELEKTIEAERSANKFLYDLLRETGSNLVTAVQKSLAVLGFTNVIDVDEEMKKSGKDASLREDLRILDILPVLIVDIKGVAGKPADAEALQAQKHAFIYIKEKNRTDVSGLTIINHQRLIPPLDRDNDMPFRKEILDNAEQLHLGLMTTWDLFRLVRGYIQHSWKPAQVKPLFYFTARIYPIPTHYEFIGRVKQVWQKAFSVQIEKGILNIGNRISIEFPVDFDEQVVSSLRVNDLDVKTSSAGQEVGIQRDETLPKLKEGFLVYRIKI
ncbi:MAG: hypothetical protein WAX69_04215 [Victivallales bacterium]